MNEDKESRAAMSRLPTLELRHHAVVAGEHTQVIGRGPDLHVLSGDDWYDWAWRTSPTRLPERLHVMTATRSTTVEIPTGDGTADAYLAQPDDDAAHPAVLLYMDAFGLRPHLRAMADRLAAAGYTVLVPNVFYRHGRAPVVALPDFITDAERPALFEQIVPLIGDLTADAVARDSAAYLSWLADCPAAAAGPVGITGYCLGARLALLTAGNHPERVAAAAGFHGAGLATDDPTSPHLLAGRITAELCFGHADEDPSMPPEQIERLDKALSAAGVRHHSEVYTGAHHGFTMADTNRFDAEAAERHWAALLDLLGRSL